MVAGPGVCFVGQGDGLADTHASASVLVHLLLVVRESSRTVCTCSHMHVGVRTQTSASTGWAGNNTCTSPLAGPAVNVGRWSARGMP